MLPATQAALRRVATLVARGEPQEAVFAAAAEEVGQLVRVELATLCRYEPGRTQTSVTTLGPGTHEPPRWRWCQLDTTPCYPSGVCSAAVRRAA